MALGRCADGGLRKRGGAGPFKIIGVAGPPGPLGSSPRGFLWGALDGPPGLGVSAPLRADGVEWRQCREHLLPQERDAALSIGRGGNGVGIVGIESQALEA